MQFHVQCKLSIHARQITEEYEQDWKKIDLSKLYIQACMESFQWRSAHGKLYARRDLVRFNNIQEANCIYCYEPQQTIKHLYTECGTTQILFKNFEKHYKLDTELTWCEKMIGMDTSMPRHKATHKRLSILGKLICMLQPRRQSAPVGQPASRRGQAIHHGVQNS
jgi:hypothetical protein